MYANKKGISMISDCHVHTEFSGDSKAPQKAQVQAALDLGMKEICITDPPRPGLGPR